MADKKSSTLDILKAIKQIVADSSDYLEDYSEGKEKRNIGLRREEGHQLRDSRVIDGFSVYFSANEMTVKYQSEMSLKETHDPQFETKIEEIIEKIVKYLKKEYKGVMNNSLSLTPVKDSLKVLVQSMNGFRTWVEAQKKYEIGGLSKMDPIKGDVKESIEKKFKDFLNK